MIEKLGGLASLTKLGLIVFAVFFGLLGLVMLVRAISERGRRPRYNVARQSSFFTGRFLFFRAIASLLFAGLLLAAYFWPFEGVTQVAVDATPTLSATASVPDAATTPASTLAATDTPPTADETAVPPQTAVPEAPQTATSPPPALSPTPTLTPTATSLPNPTPLPTIGIDQAVVQVIGGLNLRRAASANSEILELVPNESLVILLDGKELVGEITWQKVRSALGNEGWVSAEFLVQGSGQ